MNTEELFAKYMALDGLGEKSVIDYRSRINGLRKVIGVDDFYNDVTLENIDEYIQVVKYSDYNIKYADAPHINSTLSKYKKFLEYRELFRNDVRVKVTHMLSLPDIDNEMRQLVTAMRTKPFVLLAGISGTGKSRIVRELARSCWPIDSEQRHSQVPENFEMIQVRPNWHDSSELLGYVSRLDGEKFIVGDLIKFVARAWKHLDMPYFLCLDEMNLAPVEQYFAEYLSVIESRKLRNGIIVTDAIIDRSSSIEYIDGKIYKDDWYWCLIQELFGDNDVLFKKFLKEGLSLPQNLVVMGTVNMDETTFSFSRKVLDRAMTIEMNEVDLGGGLELEEEQSQYLLSGEQIIGTEVEGKDVYSENKELCDKVLRYLVSVNEILERTPFKIAYRTRNEFLVYVVNGMRMRGEIEENECLARCLDEMTSMKILSRIEGERNQVEIVLKSLKEEIEKYLKQLGVTFNVISLHKIDEMLEKMSFTGYTSFWK